MSDENTSKQQPKPKRIFRTHKENNYVVVSRKMAQNRTLTFAARGMLTYLLSKPDDWEVQPADLQQKCGRDKVYAIIRELIEAGYIERVFITDENHRVETVEYNVYEEPLQPAATEQSQPFPEKPETGRKKAARKKIQVGHLAPLETSPQNKNDAKPIATEQSQPLPDFPYTEKPYITKYRESIESNVDSLGTVSVLTNSSSLRSEELIKTPAAASALRAQAQAEAGGKTGIEITVEAIPLPAKQDRVSGEQTPMLKGNAFPEPPQVPAPPPKPKRAKKPKTTALKGKGSQDTTLPSARRRAARAKRASQPKERQTWRVDDYVRSNGSGRYGVIVALEDDSVTVRTDAQGEKLVHVKRAEVTRIKATDVPLMERKRLKPRPVQPWDCLMAAVAQVFFDCKTQAAIDAELPRVSVVVHGDKRNGRTNGIIAFECDFQSRDRLDLDYEELSKLMPEALQKFEEEYPNAGKPQDAPKIVTAWRKMREFALPTAKAAKKPRSDCPYCHGKGYYPSQEADGHPVMTICDCKNLPKDVSLVKQSPIQQHA